MLHEKKTITPNCNATNNNTKRVEYSLKTPIFTIVQFILCVFIAYNTIKRIIVCTCISTV